MRVVSRGRYAFFVAMGSCVVLVHRLASLPWRAVLAAASLLSLPGVIRVVALAAERVMPARFACYELTKVYVVRWCARA